MKVVVAGGTGFLGRALGAALAADGHEVVVLSRRAGSARAAAGGAAGRPGLATGEAGVTQGAGATRTVPWSPAGPAEDGWQRELPGAGAVVNLAGANIGRRWTAAHKERILQSRVQATRSLVEAMRGRERRPAVLINSSAVGYYGHRGDEPLSEQDGPGGDFLARVCVAWEDEAVRAEELGVRVIRLRQGIVLGRGGGALPRMALPFRLFGGGTLGSGRQWFSWIQLDDWVGLVRFLLADEAVQGPVNATAPQPVTNLELTRTLARVLRRPAFLPVPALALRLVLGEQADMLLTGQRVLPTVAQQRGYRFRYPELEEALRAAL